MGDLEYKMLIDSYWDRMTDEEFERRYEEMNQKGDEEYEMRREEEWLS